MIDELDTGFSARAVKLSGELNIARGRRSFSVDVVVGKDYRDCPVTCQQSGNGRRRNPKTA